MATLHHNLSSFDASDLPSARGMRFGIVVSEWNKNITRQLLEGAVNTLMKLGAEQKDITIQWVPGSFEIIFGSRVLAEGGNVDAIISLGCVIQGETPHFIYVCQGVTHGIAELNLKYNIPFIFGILTTDTLEQAMDRAGGKYGNKGDEAAVAAVKMICLKRLVNH